MARKIKSFLIIIVVILLLIGAYYLFQKYYEKGTEESFGSQIFDAIKGPAERIPETNPFKNIKLNPFE
jgi:predicted neutral ceramidase superfamily lipid hydrolase